MTLEDRVLTALGTVYDPELDEPITALGFVGACTVSDGGEVAVRLRLPTPQCAPNFAYLMAADARAAVLSVAKVTGVSIVLEDHYTGAEINAALARGGEFADAFPGETEGSLDALRELFRRKALLRGELGLPCGPDDAALVAGDGSPLSAEDLPTWLRRARLVSLSLETNGGLCRSLLHVRYGCPDQQEVAA